MKKLREQTDAKIESGRNSKPEFMKRVDEILLEQSEFKKGMNALKPGDKSPLFTLPSAGGEQVSLDKLLRNGPVIVTFYRGSWCPYCNLQLREFQSQIAKIKNLGAELVAISPEVPDDSLSEDEIRNMDFMVLSDQDCRVASEFGVAWKVPEFLLNHMKVDRSLDLGKLNNSSGEILPIPGTFIIDTSGEVIWSYVDVDYRRRSEPTDIVEFLEKLQK